MTDSLSDQSLLRRLREQNEDAARKLFERYSRRIAALAESQLSTRLARRIDGDDVMQSVFRTFFLRSGRGEFTVDPGNDLWCLLVQITLHKVRSQARKHTADKRDINEESPEDERASQWLSREPTPEQATILVEEMEAALSGLPETHGQILCLHFEGYTRTEIANQLKISRQTVHRVLNVIKRRFSDGSD